MSLICGDCGVIKTNTGPKILCAECVAKIEKMRIAIATIAPWLSASLLNEKASCEEYKKACDLIFEVDI